MLLSGDARKGQSHNPPPRAMFGHGGSELCVFLLNLWQ